MLDECSLNGIYWEIFGLLSLVGIVDFFDFFTVGFLVAVIPNGAWVLFAVLRFLVGFGLGASF